MSWSNWVYLGVGLGLGLGSRWLFERSKEPDVLPTAPQEPSYDVSNLLLELKQTQLAYQMVLQMSQFKAGFLVRTSHELRSPLNSLIGLNQLILSDLCDDPAEERKFVAQSYESALKLVKLLDQILEVARVEHGTNKLEIQPLQLLQVLNDVYQLNHMLAANRNLTFQLSLPDPEIYVLADPRWLRQVLMNLLDTCITQMQEGSIWVSAEPKPATESIRIWLDVQLSISAWSEPVNLMQSEHTPVETLQENAVPSPGLSLLLNQTLLERIKGRF